jgi:hypothetical protein
MQKRQETIDQGENQRIEMELFRKQRAEEFERNVSKALRVALLDNTKQRTNEKKQCEGQHTLHTQKQTNARPAEDIAGEDCNKRIAQCIWRFMCDCSYTDFELCCQVLLEVRGGNLYEASSHAGEVASYNMPKNSQSHHAATTPSRALSHAFSYCCKAAAGIMAWM